MFQLFCWATRKIAAKQPRGDGAHVPFSPFCPWSNLTFLRSRLCGIWKLLTTRLASMVLLSWALGDCLDICQGSGGASEREQGGLIAAGWGMQGSDRRPAAGMYSWLDIFYITWLWGTPLSAAYSSTWAVQWWLWRSWSLLEYICVLACLMHLIRGFFCLNFRKVIDFLFPTKSNPRCV